MSFEKAQNLAWLQPILLTCISVILEVKNYTFSTKPLSILLTKLLTHIKQGLQKYCETSYTRSGVNGSKVAANLVEKRPLANFFLLSVQIFSTHFIGRGIRLNRFKCYNQ